LQQNRQEPDQRADLATSVDWDKTGSDPRLGQCERGGCNTQWSDRRIRKLHHDRLHRRGGFEWMFVPGWSVFGEYNYMDFGTKNVNISSTGMVPGFGPAGALADTAATKLRTQTLIVGVNYKFNLGGAVAAKY